MSNPGYLVINEKEITYEMMDNEVIIINLVKGHYYSLQGIAAEIWFYIPEGITEQAIIDRLATKYNVPGEEIASSVRRFISELKAEDLILLSPSHSSESKSKSDFIPPCNEKKIFEEPVFEKYTDLEELLLLDPVHEVDEEYGWPRIKGKK